MAIVGTIALIFAFIGGLAFFFWVLDRIDNPRPRPVDDRLKQQAMQLLMEINIADQQIPSLTEGQRDRCARILRSYYGKEIEPT